jgi:hypothetical protein
VTFADAVEKQGLTLLLIRRMRFLMHNPAMDYRKLLAADFANSIGKLWVLDSKAVMSKVFRLGCTIKTTESVLSAI